MYVNSIYVCAMAGIDRFNLQFVSNDACVNGFTVKFSLLLYRMKRHL